MSRSAVERPPFTLLLASGLSYLQQPLLPLPRSSRRGPRQVPIPAARVTLPLMFLPSCFPPCFPSQV